MDAALHTFPVLHAYSQNPELRDIVLPTLRKYGGNEALEDYVGIKKLLLSRGQSTERAQNTALYMASTRADERVMARNFGGLDTSVGKLSKKQKKKFGRWTAAAFSMGASEIALNKDLRKRIKKAAGRGWSSFTDAVKNSLRAFTEVKDWRDVLDIAKVVLSAGASVAQDTIIVGIQEAMMELLDPYMSDMTTAMGKKYGKGRRAIRNATKQAVKNVGGNQTVQKIAGEFTDAVYDLIFGLPMCMLEKACIQPVATALSKVDVPYVKAIGEALKVIYPILQGNHGGYADEPQSCVALGMYAGGEVPLLPNAKLPPGAGKFVKNVLDVLDEKAEWAVGMPTAFNRFEPYLVDMVARGAKGPYVYGSTENRAKVYMKKPWTAEKVIKKANNVSGFLDTVDRYLRKINRYVEMGKQAYDVYQAIDSSDMSFDLEEWNAEDLSDVLSDKVNDVQSWATKEAQNYQRRAMDAIQNIDKIAERLATRQIEKYKKIVMATVTDAQSSISRTQTSLSNFQDPAKRNSFIIDARSAAGQAAVKAQADAEAKAQRSMDSVSKLGQSVKGRIFVPSKFNFGATGTAESFMGEWMIAQIGLAARARYNDMAQQWLESTPAERSKWKKAPASRWKEQAIDYPAWHQKFKNSDKMKRMQIAQAAHQMPMAKLSILLQVAEATGNSAVVPVLKEVVNVRGRHAGIVNLAQIGLGISRNLISVKQSAQQAVEEGLVSQAEIDAYTGKKPIWLMPAIAAGTAVTGAAILVALTE